MAVFRVQKIKDYTVMSNYHLKDKTLTLKAKGLFSVILSLPENWDYTMEGLAKICKEGIDCVSGAVRELEEHGYIIRERVRNSKGQLKETEYTILEQPKTAEPIQENPKRENPVLDKPKQDKPTQENPAQLNTNTSNKKELNTDVSNTYPIKSEPQPQNSGKSDKIGVDEIAAYRELIKQNIEYDILRIKLKSDLKMLNDLVDIMTETVCTSRSHLTVASDTFPAETVKSKLLKLNSEHIEYVIDCLKNTKTDIRKTRQYMLTALFNAPTTIETYYTTKVNHDMYGGD